MREGQNGQEGHGCKANLSDWIQEAIVPVRHQLGENCQANASLKTTSSNSLIDQGLVGVSNSPQHKPDVGLS